MSDDPKNQADPKEADATADPKQKETDPPPPNDPKEADAPEVYMPEGLPDHMKGKTHQEIIDNLHKAYKGARDELAGKSKIPEKLDDYTIDLGDLGEKLLQPGEDGKDPVFEKLRGLLHANKIPPETARALAAGLYEEIAAFGENGDDGQPLADFDYKEFGGPDKAKPVLDGVSAWAQGLKNQGRLDDADLKEIELMAMSSEGLRTLSKLREVAGEKPIPAEMGADSAGGKITEADLNRRIADPRYWRDRDPAFIAETSKMFEEVYGKKQSA